VLGRLPESPVHFEQPEVSYRHAAIRRHGAQWQVKDLGSTNGTTVDGQRIDDWTDLHSGSVIALAGVRLTAVTDTSGTVHLQGLTGR
jgi:pSer/pThr/pTyr-binding forkhead associated (FHA) protein